MALALLLLLLELSLLLLLLELEVEEGCLEAELNSEEKKEKMGWEAILEYGLLFSFAWVLLGLGQKNDLDGAELVVVLFGFPRCFSIIGLRYGWPPRSTSPDF